MSVHTSGCSFACHQRGHSSAKIQRLGQCNTLLLFFFWCRFSAVLGIIVQVIAVEQMAPPDYLGLHRSSWSTGPGPVAAKQAQIITPPPQRLTVCLCWYAVFGFCPNVALCIMAKHLYFCLVCLKNIIPEVLWFVQMQLCKPQPCCHVLFRDKKLSPGNPSKQAIFLLSFSNCIFINFNS